MIATPCSRRGEDQWRQVDITRDGCCSAPPPKRIGTRWRNRISQCWSRSTRRLSSPVSWLPSVARRATEGPVQRHVAAWLAAHGLTPELQPTEGDRPNVVARIENGDGPTLLLNGHVDTVLAVEGWSTDPWTPHRDGDRLYGLGAADMKSGVAAAMLAARWLHQHRQQWRGTVIFSSVVDEEAYSIGARALIASGIVADYCIVTESSWDRPAIGSVG